MKTHNLIVQDSLQLAKIREKSFKLQLWDSDIMDKLIFDIISRIDLDVKSFRRTDLYFSIKKNKRCKHFDRVPVHLLPYCVSYQGENNKFSWVYAMFELEKRSQYQGGLIIGWINTRDNEFLLYMLNLMGHKRDQNNTKEYWRLANNLLKNEVFKIACFNYVVNNWYLDLNGHKIEKILNELDNYIKTRPLTIDYRRVYIDKGKDNKKKDH